MKSGAQGLLITKFEIPALQQNAIPRPLLENLLDSALSHALTLVSAPAGYGKTNLMAAWALRQDRTVAWLSLDSADNDITRFLMHLQGTLRYRWPALKTEPAAIRGLAKMPAAEDVLVPLINQLSSLDHDILLLMDDVHLIESSDVHSALSFLLDHRPNNPLVIPFLAILCNYFLKLRCR